MTVTTTALLDAALAYAARGWHVFPCHTPDIPRGMISLPQCSCRRKKCPDIGKHPRTEHGFKDATTDEVTIRRWWKLWPEANIGVATGAGSGLVALDEDTYKGGDQSRIELEQSYSPLPETVLQLTGGGGVQYFFAHPGLHVKNGVESLGVGLDVRGDGGYVIAPPSLHGSGKRYMWEVIHEPDDIALAPMPAWLLALCQDTARREAPSAGEPILDGHRNDTLFKLGCSFRARNCTEAVILAALREMNATQCQPPLADGEVVNIAASAAKYKAGPSREDLHTQRNGITPPATNDPPSSPVDTADEDYPYSDAYNALRLVRAHGQDMRYCTPWRSWLTWCGTHWQRDTTGLVMRWQRQTVKALGAQVPDLEDEAAKKLMGHIKSSLNTARLKAAVEQAQSWEGMSVDPACFDADPWALNCTNGTLDLHTGILRPHRREDMLTRCLPLAYDENARCPRWLAFLETVMAGNADLIAFLQKALGYSLTGSTREQCFFLLHGVTKTGKSTFINIAKALLGPYGTQAEMSTFLHKDRETVRNDLADLAGMRLVCAIETDEGKRLAAALIKQLTGGSDSIKARFLFEEYFEYRPQFKVFLATNFKPKVDPTDDALWERVRLIPFLVQIPKADRNKQLEEEIREELSGILAWAVRGCLAWQAADSLGEPGAVVGATQQYREEMDEVGQFLATCILGDAQIYKTQAHVLFKAYQQWGGKRCENPKAFNKALTDRHYEAKRGNSGNFWLGIGLPSEPRED